ncbi:MAG: formate--tetrahydrofolate ligase, partial [Methylobacter sp.]
MSDIEIAQKANMKPIIGLVNEHYGIDAIHLDPYGHYKAKLSLDYVNNSLADKKEGKLILVT